MLTQEQIDSICDPDRAGEPLHFLWGYVGRAHGIGPQQIAQDSFEERKNDFLFIIGKFLDEGRFKLGNRKDGLIMEGSTEVLVEMFRSCFPASDEALEKGTWLVFEECPFVAVWVLKGVGEHGEDDYDWCF
ncbi:DUF596 domain-containing protein [Xylella taiwanensis]|uniref:DUF596 domain-containing protein n=1 Tax=Xylella taiwanensis TaxID=1444770 RepID=Z9JF05_9GAMM|nr:DUF596 domain-containing protein [Xylella taiwanensis]AXI83706.1 hypothetical protein AB672_07070 [Xylella taiwanensis]EWS76965.1 hypothetical protein AF72_13375 [Xylella taiwanensis]MCD8456803.1 DUF596 domain-containing protein [Xylella taiwanensis]MCD8459213.1 DUF596 domain-containing protein [Xylella taiwanensis]MCD8462061.1 DUF596 domain-containing protein [Xylella taiwanensis]